MQSQMIRMDEIILCFDLSEYFLSCTGLYLQMLLDALLNYGPNFSATILLEYSFVIQKRIL